MLSSASSSMSLLLVSKSMLLLRNLSSWWYSSPSWAVLNSPIENWEVFDFLETLVFYFLRLNSFLRGLRLLSVSLKIFPLPFFDDVGFFRI